MTTEMSDKIAALGDDADWSDPNLYAGILGAPSADDEPATDPAPEGEAEATDVAASEAKESSATPAAAASESPTEEVVADVATKDGKRVIPYAVLHDARQTAAQATARAKELAEANTRLAQQLQQAQSTHEPDASKAEFTKDELAEMEADFPQMAKLAKAHAALKSQLVEQAEAAQAARGDEVATGIQELIDNRPLLARWQSKGGGLWQDAVALDSTLRTDPAWASKSMADRFAEVERRMADELGIEVPPQTPVAVAVKAAQQTPKLPDPKPAPKPTLSDFNGSAPRSKEDEWNATSPRDALARAQHLSEADLMRMAGVSW